MNWGPHDYDVELPGVEPRFTEPESVVLPLHHSSVESERKGIYFLGNTKFFFANPKNKKLFPDYLDLIVQSELDDGRGLARGALIEGWVNAQIDSRPD